MSEDLELTSGSAGIDRRDFIRKSAIVGGMVWAAPMIQSIGSPAFAFGTGDPFEFACKTDISNIQILIVNGGGAAYKKEAGKDLDVSNASPPCVNFLSQEEIDRFCAANPPPDGLMVYVDEISTFEWNVRITPDDGTYSIAWVTLATASDCYFNKGSSVKTDGQAVTSLRVGCDELLGSVEGGELKGNLCAGTTSP